ncbi:SPX domain-containing protein [Fimicolochytrium jonesii]|uniref:SPX domain-containing protein n=1 Tax=Fimicolochytrium jonesii TaxID=1396493 RepID=UPI0022FDECD4|nr:SPX domain-containing protein [Fimicolochytrium jonesii]KAI8818109.1 SPX domain-containing protein [Fimicolochytrium jonesii]
MKFAKYLEENSVPEWRSQYVDYRQLKKLIKQVVKARHREKQPKVSVPILEDDENKEKEEETDDNPPYGMEGGAERERRVRSASGVRRSVARRCFRSTNA